jgi:hypothetical protein
MNRETWRRSLAALGGIFSGTHQGKWPMNPQERFDSFLAYLEDSPSLTPEQKREIEGRIDKFRPYQSEYLPPVFPGGLHWFYRKDRATCVRIIESLFLEGNLKASLNKLSGGWKTLTIEHSDLFVLDLLYSYKNNLNNLSGQIIESRIIDKKFDSTYIINKLNKIKEDLILLTREDNDVSKLIDNIDEITIKIYDKNDVLNRELIRAIKKDNKVNIIRHLGMIFKHYAFAIGSEVLCKRIYELLVVLYPGNNYNFNMIKKDLQRHKPL